MPPSRERPAETDSTPKGLAEPRSSSQKTGRDFGKVPVTDRLLTRAERLAWKHGLRAYDAVQLAAALVCQETITELDESVLFACFDDELTAAANDEGLRTWPD